MKVHKDFPNYKICPTGKVWSNKTNNYMAVVHNPNGYLLVGLTDKLGKKKKLYIHRLVAEMFCIERKDAKQVNHKDGNKLNNTYTNLEWCTARENMKHARDTGLHNQDGEHNNQAKFTDAEIQRVLILLEETVLSQRAIGAIVGMSQQHISQIHNGTRRNK